MTITLHWLEALFPTATALLFPGPSIIYTTWVTIVTEFRTTKLQEPRCKVLYILSTICTLQHGMHACMD